MPLTLQDGRRKLVAFTTDITEGEDPTALSVASLTNGVDIQCKILKSDFRLSPVASDTVADTPLCSTGNAVVFGASNYEGNVTPFVYYDETGALETDENDVYELFAEKGAHVWILDRLGKPESEPLAEGDHYRLWHVITDEPQDPTDAGGYIKHPTPLGVQRLWRGTLVAGGSGGSSGA